MKISRNRIEEDFKRIASCGALKNGGVTRMTLSDADMQAREILIELMRDAHLEVTVDHAGNIRGTRAGRETLPPVMVGSHLDTVPNGGHYDGVIGVLGGLEVVRALNEAGITTKRPIEIVNFTAEESSRFGIATLGSRAMTGKIDASNASKICDKDGISFFDALSGCGFTPQHLGSSVLRANEVHAFIELHIEQGPVLEDSKIPVGIVTAIAAATRFKIALTGRADHSGTTPIGKRKDALAAAAELVLEVEKIAQDAAISKTVATVGTLQVEPGVMNVVPGRVGLSIDIRGIDDAPKSTVAATVISRAEEISRKRGVLLEYETLCDERPVPMTSRLVDTLERIAAEKGIQAMRLHSGAGHDAMIMAEITDTAMIFVPSIGGISHNIAERSDFDDVALGVSLLAEGVLVLANE